MVYSTIDFTIYIILYYVIGVMDQAELVSIVSEEEVL